MVSKHMLDEVRRLKAADMSQSAITRKLKLDRKTVAKYGSSPTRPAYAKRSKSTRADPLQGLLGQVEEWFKQAPTLTDRELYELLVPAGYQGSEGTLNRRMKGLRPVPEEGRFYEQEYQPGEQAQFDFKESLTFPFVGGPQLVHLLFGTLPYSGTVRIKAFPFKTYECFMDGVHSFYEQLGGLTRAIRFDNQRIYTEAFKRAANYYGFELLPCSPGKGSDKGDVEREIRTRTNRILNRISHESRIFRGWDDLNAWLLKLVLEFETAAVLEKQQEEQAKLVPLPPRDEAILSKILLTKPNPTAS